MENEELKALVLARCGEATKDSNYASSNIHDWDMEHEDGLYKLDAWKGCLSIAVDQSTPADNKVWPLAAEILKVGRFSIPQKTWEDNIKEGLEEAFINGYNTRKNEPRPSNELLWEAFQEAKSVDYLAFGHLVAKQAKQKNREQFEAWIATLPPDPLAADKASIQTELANGLERKLIDAYCTGDAIAAIKRFAGMEVENG